MTTKYLDSNGLLYLWQKIRNTFVSDVTWDSTNKKLIRKKKTGANGAEESTDIVTLSTVATSGSYNDLSNKPTIPTLKNVFGKVKVGSSTIEADTTQDTLELAAGSNVTLTADTANDKVTITATPYNQVFIATYDSTAFSDISDAYEDGKAVFVYDPTSHRLAPLTNITSDDFTFSTTFFTNATGLGIVFYSCTDDDGWGSYDEVVVTDVKAGNISVLDNRGQALLGTASAKSVVTAISADSADLPTVTAVKNYVASAVTGATAFQGTVTSSFAPTNYLAGYYWVVGTAGTYAGQVCEAGDMIFAIEDGTSYSASKFDVVQTNLDITAITNAEIDTIVAA